MIFASTAQLPCHTYTVHACFATATHIAAQAAAKHREKVLNS
jgi:hypothetical protein